MSRIRLQISGVASLAEARIAVEAGADAIGIDPAAFPAAGLAGNDLLAEIALALPPAVTPILVTRALTAGTIAQQVDAAAALAVRLESPLPASEYPGLKRIIRGRKIIQSLAVDRQEAFSAAMAWVEFADALHLVPTEHRYLPLCARIADKSRLPVFLKLADVRDLADAIEVFRPFGIELAAPRGRNGIDALTIADLARRLA